LGETIKQQNRQSVRYLQRTYGRYPKETVRRITYERGIVEVTEETDMGAKTVMMADARGEW
jgi:hypothetical protein